MNDMQKMYAPFSITMVIKKIRYCNNHVIPLLKKKNIEWDMDTRRIIFCGKTFPMRNIDDGKAEEFINSLNEDHQLKLDIYVD